MMTFSRSFRFFLLVIFVLAPLALGRPDPARAASVVVNTLVDESDLDCTDGDCSLRDAVYQADSGDTITFSVTGTITLSLGEISIDDSMTITGPGPGLLTVNANDASRIFYVNGGVTVVISGMTLTNGSLTMNNGGAIINHGNLTLNDMALTNNEALGTGPATYVKGGAIYNASNLTITNSTLSDNRAWYLGGGVYSDFGTTLNMTDVIVTGNDALGEQYTSGGGISIASDISTPSGYSLTNVSLTYNTSNYAGGGIYVQQGASGTITGSLIDHNTSIGVTEGAGGGVYAIDQVSLTITDTTISNNTSLVDGGGINAGAGGLVIRDTTISGNEVTDTGFSGAGLNLYNGTAEISNSTISGNFGAGSGGGIEIAASATVTINNSTIASNQADNAGGVSVSGVLSMSNTLIGDNQALVGSHPDCSVVGTLNSFGYNLIDNTTGCTFILSTGDLSGVDPELYGLADNGGPTRTHALQSGSPAVDAGDNGQCEPADQRGVSRPQDGDGNSTLMCDIGAVEMEPDPSIDVSIAGTNQGNYLLDATETTWASYPATIDGPVTVAGNSSLPILTSQRATSGDSYNELMGVPPAQFTTEYWFPWYDHGYPSVGGSSMRTWILVGNPDDTLTAEVDIYIGGALQDSYSIPPGSRVTPRWIGLQDGPVRVVSDIPVFASERVFTVPDNSFNETFGYPANQFTTEYWFPWYDSVNMSASVLAGNTSASQSAEVDIFIGPTFMGSYTIAADDTLIQAYPSTIDGPVRVVATNGVDIVASESALSGPVGNFTRYNEVMGYPFDQFDTDYSFPWYDHGYPGVGGSNMRTWVLVGNPDDTLTASVDIYIDGTLMGNYSVAPNSRITPRWIGLQGGPVQVRSDIPVFVSQRVFTAPGNVFNEMMGYPSSQLTNEYWFPWYDSVNMNNDVIVSRP